ncbi:MAG: hypothetical protein J7524_22385 [Roseofilum sp. Belize BBD 4]|nr:hypothetical protein [Roseofilum sp. Belize BBD 4]MBP0035874.1 hypothetical protein [Roseofilum sp. Belize BBD 4]
MPIAYPPLPIPHSPFPQSGHWVKLQLNSAIARASRYTDGIQGQLFSI